MQDTKYKCILKKKTFSLNSSSLLGWVHLLLCAKLFQSSPAEFIGPFKVLEEHKKQP